MGKWLTVADKDRSLHCHLFWLLSPVDCGIETGQGRWADTVTHRVKKRSLLLSISKSFRFLAVTSLHSCSTVV